MYSLILLVYLSSAAIGITHIDNFTSEHLCEQAGKNAMVEARKFDDKKIHANYVCVLEIR